MSYIGFKNVDEVKNLEKLMEKVSDFRQTASHYIKDPVLKTSIDKTMLQVHKKLDKEKWKNFKK